jgi:fimbrial isopeptide formation D2 family protein/LPXTG-motif cell wall-anchored protein
MADYTSYTFKITDKPQNLDIDISSVKVSIGENDITKLLTGKITLTGEDKEKTLTVDLGEYLFTNKASLKEGDVILVTYKAKLTSDAIETSTATNDAQITYSNNPYADGEGEVTIPQGTEKVYTYSVTFNKKSSLGKDLSGAKFKLRILDGQYINIDKDSKVVTLVDEENASEFEGGTFTVTGLKAGTYELVETQAPSEDYKKAEGLIFTISNNDKSTIGTTLEDGVIITHTLSKDENADNLEIINGGTNLGVFEVNVINNRTLKSILLPSTGGIGTTIFAVIGIVLMISAVIALVVINKKSNK